MKSAMHDEFNKAWKQSGCEWIAYCGSWMFYDGALFVTRDGF